MGGMLELSTMYLPINQNWSIFQQECQSECDDSVYILNNLLEKVANEACEFVGFKEYVHQLRLKLLVKCQIILYIL